MVLRQSLKKSEVSKKSETEKIVSQENTSGMFLENYMMCLRILFIKRVPIYLYGIRCNEVRMDMEEILFTGKSATHAQIMKKILNNRGIDAEIVRPDVKITSGNCSYAVRISQGFFAEAIEILKENRTTPVRAVLIRDTYYRELKI